MITRRAELQERGAQKSTKRVPYNALTPISIFFVVLFFIFTRAPDFAKKEGLLQSSIVTLNNQRNY